MTKTVQYKGKTIELYKGDLYQTTTPWVYAIDGKIYVVRGYGKASRTFHSTRKMALERAQEIVDILCGGPDREEYPLNPQIAG